MTEIEIIDSKTDRDRMMNRTDVLDKVKALATLPGHGEATTAQVADFYEVERGAIDNVILRHRDELKSNGYRSVTGQELRELKASVTDSQNGSLSKKSRSVAVWDRRAVLNLGMLLRDSEVAKEVRRYLLDSEQAVHAEVTGDQSGTLDVTALGDSIARAVADWVEPRFQSLEERLSDLENQGSSRALGNTKVPSSGTLAEIMGIPSHRNGKPLKTGVSSKDGRPWARYGDGKSAEWLDRNPVIQAYNSIN